MTGFRTALEMRHGKDDNVVRDGEVRVAPCLLAILGECPPGKPHVFDNRDGAETLAKQIDSATVWEHHAAKPPQVGPIDSLAILADELAWQDKKASRSLALLTMGVSGAAGGGPDQQPASPASAPQEPDGCSKADEPTETVGLAQTGAAADETDRGTTTPDPRRDALQDGQRQGSTPGAPGAHLAFGRVHCGDCLELIYRLEPGSVDFVFADLPYSVTANKWDRPIDLSKMWAALRYACKPTAAMVFTAIQPFASDLVQSNRKDFRFEMIWRKNIATGFLNANKRPLRNHENILLFWREEPLYQPQKTTGHPLSKVTPSRRGEGKYSHNYGAENGRLLKTLSYESTERHPTTILTIDCVEQHDPSRRHPTQKPCGLSEYFIRTYTSPGALVLDPTAGSGSTLEAAMSLARRAIGFDIDPEAVRRANSALCGSLNFARAPSL